MPKSGLSSFLDILRGSCCTLGCAVQGILKATVDSFANESMRWEAACIREFLQSVERLEGE